MRCGSFNQDIALYVEGDLEPSRSQIVEAHLGHCAGCRALVDELQRSQDEIRSLRNEIVDSSALALIRSNVLTQVRIIEERKTWLNRAGMWLWGNLRYAVFGVLALIVLGVITRHSHPPEPRRAVSAV